MPANKGRRLPAELLSGEEGRALLRACSSRGRPESATAPSSPPLPRRPAHLRTARTSSRRTSTQLRAFSQCSTARATSGGRSAWTRPPSPYLSAGSISATRSVHLLHPPGRVPRIKLHAPADPPPGARTGIQKCAHAHGLRHAHAGELPASPRPAPSERCASGSGRSSRASRGRAASGLRSPARPRRRGLSIEA